MRFKGKIDTWIKVYLFVVLFYLIYMTVVLITNELYALLIIPMISGILIIDILQRTYYEFKTEYLFIRSTIFFIKIKYEDIELIKIKEGFIHGFALSKKQVEIKIRNKGSILGKKVVAPLDRDLFIKELKKYCNFTESEV